MAGVQHKQYLHEINHMAQLIFTATSITGIILLAFAVEQLGETFVEDYQERRKANQKIDDLQES